MSYNGSVRNNSTFPIRDYGVTLMILKNLIAALVCMPLISIIAHAQVSEPGPTSQSGSTYQLPLAVEKQLAVVKQEAIRCQAQKHGSAELTSAVNTLQAMIPCSATMRQLLQQQQSLHQKMAIAASGPEYEKLTASARSISSQIEQDPAYAQAMRAIDARLAPSYRKPAVRTSFPSMSELQPGDILLYDGRTFNGLSNGSFLQVEIEHFAYAQTFTHAALYLGTYGLGFNLYRLPLPGGKDNPLNQKTYAADGSHDGVRSSDFFFVQNSTTKPYGPIGWNYPGLHVAIGRVNNTVMIQDLVTCIRAYNTFHDDGRTPYHKMSPFVSWNKTSIKNGLICSQLVWYVYNQAHIDLDSNDPNYIAWFALHNAYNPFLLLFSPGLVFFAYEAVFPDELRASPNITWYYDQTNPQINP